MAEAQTTNPISLDPSTFYDEVSASRALRVPASTLAKARKDRAIRYSRRGQRVLYRGDWLAEWVSAGEVPPIAGTPEPELASA